MDKFKKLFFGDPKSLEERGTLEAHYIALIILLYMAVFFACGMIAGRGIYG